MPKNDSKRVAGHIGAHVSWSNTVDRSKRTEPARANGPASVDYWIARQGPEFADATPEQRLAAAESAKRAHYSRMALKSAKARRRSDS